MKKIIFLFAILLMVVNCGPKVYTDPSASQVITNHRSIAIVPPTVSIEARKNIDIAVHKEQQKTESKNFQNEMYSWLLKRKSQGKINIEIQDVSTTNAILQKAGYFDNPGSFSPKDLGIMVGTDAILTSNYSLSKPMSQGAAVAMAVLVGAFGATNSTVVDLNVYDSQSAKMIWSYNHKAGSTFGSPAGLVDNLMRDASKRMPYIKK